MCGCVDLVVQGKNFCMNEQVGIRHDRQDLTVGSKKQSAFRSMPASDAASKLALAKLYW
jgi:hypothetical protein